MAWPNQIEYFKMSPFNMRACWPNCLLAVFTAWVLSPQPLVLLSKEGTSPTTRVTPRQITLLILIPVLTVLNCVKINEIKSVKGFQGLDFIHIVGKIIKLFRLIQYLHPLLWKTSDDMASCCQFISTHTMCSFNILSQQSHWWLKKTWSCEISAYLLLIRCADAENWPEIERE